MGTAAPASVAGIAFLKTNPAFWEKGREAAVTFLVFNTEVRELVGEYFLLRSAQWSPAGVEVFRALWMGGPALVLAFWSSFHNTRCPASAALGMEVQEKGRFKPSWKLLAKKPS